MSEGRVPLKGPAEQEGSTPTDRKLPDGQYADHWVLSAEERAKGYIRPVRWEYRHVGPPGPRGELRDLTEEELERWGKFGYVKYEPYPEGGAVTGRFWSQEQLDLVDSGCGRKTSMPMPIAQTYARQPTFYGSTFCAHCGVYRPVGAHGEFVWADGSRVGT